MTHLMKKGLYVYDVHVYVSEAERGGRGGHSFSAANKLSNVTCLPKATAVRLMCEQVKVVLLQIPNPLWKNKTPVAELHYSTTVELH